MIIRMLLKLKSLFCITLFGFLPNFVNADFIVKSVAHSVVVTNAWIREPIVESDIHAGYFTLFNRNNTPLILNKIESAAYDRVEIHEMKHVNGLMKMREIKELVIPAQGQAILAPRGKHLMLIKPSQKIKSGGQVTLKLKFKNGKTQVLVMPIRSK